MNIHFKDKDLFEQLRKATLAQVEVGSQLYGLQDPNSDKDLLCIYFPFRNQIFGFVQTHHQLQFKDSEGHTDYLFVDIFTFVRNALSGDSTINFEALHLPELLQTPLDFLHHYRYYFYNYLIVKSYLGFANRDLKQYWQQPTEREALKKYTHALRGYIFARQLIDRPLLLNEPLLREKKILFSTLDLSGKKEVLVNLQAEIDNFRKNIVNKAAEAGKLVRYMVPAHQQEINNRLLKLSHTSQAHYALEETIDLSLLYNVNENGVLYE